MPRYLLSLVVVVTLILTLNSPVSALPSLDEAMKDRAMGSESAPVTITEYSSLTCPHCMAFHRDTLPELKKNYIDTGKVRLIFRDFPLGGLAMAAAMMARCAKPDRYFGVIEILFRGQAEWAGSENPMAALTRIGRLAGLSDKDVQACMQNRNLWEAIQKRAQNAGKKHKIESTPSFVIGDRTISGALPFSEFKKIIDSELKKKK
ncbi:MAG: DsbA family protein [Rhodospirillaceae bacterium]